MARLIVFPIAFSVLCSITHQAPVDSNAGAIEYLEHFGYVRNNDGSADQRKGRDFSEAIKTFQRFANITVTGVIDDVTMEMMNRPRCGMQDFIGTANEVRRKRYNAQAAWRKTDLTYMITQYTQDMPQNEVDFVIAKAFNVWAEVTPLTFTQIYSGIADIVILFEGGYHGDNGPFDGPGGVLAHAYFPEVGDAHFDDDEYFTRSSYYGVNLFQVAAHEFGHSLGLGHTDVSAALMAPFYAGYQPYFQLHLDDIYGIQALYGMSDNGELTVAPHPNPNPGQPGCEGVFDAVTTTADGSTYMFKGQYFWKLNDNGLPYNGYPKLISNEWAGLPDNLDAGLYWTTNQRTYFFKGDQYWRYYNQMLDAGYPKSISVWRRLPSNIDAAFVWSGNGKTYFIKGDQYYRYTSGYGVDSGYPRPLTVWGGLPNSIDAAFQWRNGRTYFFSSSDYYRYNDFSNSIDDTYPRQSSLWWLGCSNNLLQDVTMSTNSTEVITENSYVDGSSGIPSMSSPMLCLILLLCFIK